MPGKSQLSAKQGGANQKRKPFAQSAKEASRKQQGTEKNNASDKTTKENARTSAKEAAESRASGKQAKSGKGKASTHVIRRRATDLKNQILQRGPTDAEIIRGKGDSSKAGTHKSRTGGRNASSSGEASPTGAQENSSRVPRPSADESAKRVVSSGNNSADKQSRKSAAKSQAKNGSSAKSKTNTGQSGGQNNSGSGQQSEAQSKQSRSGRQGAGQKKGRGGTIQAGTLASSSRRGKQGTLGRSASPSDLFPGSGMGAERGGAGWASALSDLGAGNSSGNGRRAGSASGPPRTLPTAWLKAATNGPVKATELASGWNAMELTLGEENGKVTVQARSDQDHMNVSVRFTEGRLRAQVAANARQIQDTMQAQYGSNVDLSFAGGDPDESGGQTSDGSLPERRSSPDSAAESSENESNTGITYRRGPNGENEWIG